MKKFEDYLLVIIVHETSHFFDSLPISPKAYGGDTAKYLDQLKAPEDE